MKGFLILLLALTQISCGATTYLWTKRVDSAAPTPEVVTATPNSLWTIDGSGNTVTQLKSVYATSTALTDGLALKANLAGDNSYAGENTFSNIARFNLGSRFDGSIVYLSDTTVSMAAAAQSEWRAGMGLGTLSTQSGTFSGTSSGTNTGDQTNITGNAGTATVLATPRTIFGESFDGSAAIGVKASLSGQSLTGSQATNLLDLSTTWDTTGDPNLIYGRVTNTNSGIVSDLIDLGTAAGGGLFRVNMLGNVIANVYSGAGTGLTGTASGLTAGNATLAAGLSATLTGASGGTGVANTGKTITIGASLTTTGTDLPTFAFPSAATARTYTFPTTTATLARTDAAQTFTGLQTVGSLTTNNGQITIGSGFGMQLGNNLMLFPSASGVLRFGKTDDSAGFRLNGTTNNVCEIQTFAGSGRGSLKVLDFESSGASTLTGGATIGGGTAVAKWRHGTATLASGTVTVADAAITTSSRIWVNRFTDGGTVGDSYSITRSAGANFTITSKTANATVAGDTSVVAYQIIEP